LPENSFKRQLLLRIDGLIERVSAAGVSGADRGIFSGVFSSFFSCVTSGIGIFYPNRYFL